MEVPASCLKKYEMRKRGKPQEWKSRVDWKRTKKDAMVHLLDSEEDDEEGRASVSEYEKSESDDGEARSSDAVPKDETSQSNDTTADQSLEDNESITPARRKRPSSRVMCDTDSDSDVCSPVRKVRSKRRRALVQEDEGQKPMEVSSDTEEEDAALEKEEANKRKSMRLSKLKELSAKKRALGGSRPSNSSGIYEDSDEDVDHLSISPAEYISDEDEDADSLNDFIVEDETEENEDESSVQEPKEPKSLVDHHIPLYGTRKKRYAQDLLLSLHFFDERFIEPRLTNLKQRSRWTERYQNLIVGSMCAERTQVYHRLKHFKYHLYSKCCSITQLEKDEEETGKDTVKRILVHFSENGWIQQQYDILEKLLDEADVFQEEKLD
ncbi:coiled-coil domain-containing protein 82 isoform X2 [Protopterus annectens]|uniref:coiled-coil domain-containing protein 82 isoform X2 n=1 Tax=Protopterus annectens TaxID=7888 RepID=UPI001CFAFCC3|nr:coiled-coil domain-containing protein 82 isoform X2 [Protopterus annectens]